MLPFLLEIGTEEIPDWMIPSALEYLRAKFPGENVRVDGTGRRLVLRSDVAARSADREEIVTGPPASVTGKALDGFCAKQGVTAAELSVAETAKGKYWSFTRKIQGRAAIETLREEIPALIMSIPWPKTMYWPSMGGPKFIRPVRWIVALLGEEVVPFECAGVTSGDATFGHRRLGARGPLPVTVENFEQVLRDNFVIVSAAERRAKIETEVAAVAAARGLQAKPDAKLLEVLTYITEYPTAILGSFDPSYLQIPAEVLVTVMRFHQKYFAVEHSDGSLAPNFVAIMNIPADPEGHVVNGNERVLRARFNDAMFFANMDAKIRLVHRSLENVTFHAKLGNYEEKTERITKLAEELGGYAAGEAASLCKRDLTTDLVKEFTELQGVIGGIYAREQGKSEEVWRAIYEHYKPLSMEDSIPSTVTGQALSVADKIDTLREFAKIGQLPKGSSDPFGLRRAAQGVIKIMAEGTIVIPLMGLLQGNFNLRGFFLDRISHYCRNVRGYEYDLVNAAIHGGWNDPKDLLARLEALRAIRMSEDFVPLVASLKRIKNIVDQAGDIGQALPEVQLFMPIEVSLWTAVQRLAEHHGDYSGLFHSMASIRPTIDQFFDQVLVNDPDPKIRENRLRLLQGLLAKFSSIADFSEIVTN